MINGPKHTSKSSPPYIKRQKQLEGFAMAFLIT